MAFDAKEFLADVLAQVPEDKRAAVEEALSLEPISKKLESGVLRQDEFSRKMDELAKSRKEAEGQLAHEKSALESEKQRYANWYAGASKEYNDALELAERYQKEYGTLDEGTQPQQPPGMTQQELEKRLAAEFDRRDRQAVQFADILTDIKLDHLKRFDEKLDTQALYQHLEKTGLRIDHAYQDFISPRVAEAEKEKFEEAVKQAREEGRKEGLSSANLPVQPDSRPARSIAALDKPSTSDDRVAAAVADWNNRAQ